MPKPVLTRKRSWIARIAVLAMVFSLLAVALPASAHSVALSTSTSCPSTIPSAGFNDIGGFDATTQLAINCLFAFGITTGTSATTYSPNDTVTRWQMALFLVRQAADHGITIPAATNQGYSDIGALPQSTQDAINQITQLGISKGTSTTTFSPNLGVSRWQMALFIYRTGLAAGVSFSNTVGHNDFTDTGGLLEEAQTAINALADTRVDPQGHIALGTGGSAFSPELLLARWQMALFLTRLLAADNIAAPAGLRVTVTPTDTVSLSQGTGRTYTATFKNADGTPYVGAVGVMLRIVSSAGVVDWDGLPTAGTNSPDNTIFEAPTDGLIAGPVGPGGGPTIRGFPGSDGVVSFTVRHSPAVAAERIVPVAWEDINGDLDAEIVGNNPPTEPFGVGGQTAFGFVAGECLSGPIVAVVVTAVDKDADRFEGGGCSYFYDSNDLFRILGAGTDLAGFEAALNTGDTINGTYDADTADQSTFDITTNTQPGPTVTSPAAAVTVDAPSFTITGTGIATYTVAIYTDLDNNGAINGADANVGEGVVQGDGTWAISVPLAQNVDNNFTANQRQFPPSPNGTPVNVPTITEGASVAPLITNTVETNNGALGFLDAGDTLVLTFDKTVDAPNSGDSLSIFDAGGDQVRLICGTNGTTCVQDSATQVTVTVGTPTVDLFNDNGLIDDDGAAQFFAQSGWSSPTGNLNVTGSPAAGRVITGF